jgi:hypothetical protein
MPLRKRFVLFLLLDGYRQYLGFAPANTINYNIILEIDNLSEVVIAKRIASSQNLFIIGFPSFPDTSYNPKRGNLLS